MSLLTSNLRYSSLFLALGALVVTAGCQEGGEYRTEKPVVEESVTQQVEQSVDETAAAVSEAASDAADAVTPDEEIVDIKTPLGDVRVGNDPVTGDTNVDVDAGQADLDGSTDNR